MTYCTYFGDAHFWFVNLICVVIWSNYWSNRISRTFTWRLLQFFYWIQSRMQILLSFLMSCSRCGSRNHFSYRWLLFLRSYTSYVYPFENIFWPGYCLLAQKCSGHWFKFVLVVFSPCVYCFFYSSGLSLSHWWKIIIIWLESQSEGDLLFRGITVNICEKHKFLQTTDILSNGIVLHSCWKTSPSERLAILTNCAIDTATDTVHCIDCAMTRVWYCM